MIAKTIRSHPTSHILVLEPFLGNIVIFSRFGPKMELRFLHFPTSLHVKRLAPKGKKMRMDHPFILGFSQNVTFDIVFTIIFSLVREKTTFLNYCHLLIILCISDSNMGNPRLLLFQNRTPISKFEPYPKGISISIYSSFCFVSAAKAGYSAK